MEETKFIHRVSKGSKFSQIYIPHENKNEFEPGDLVEVRLLKKDFNIYYSKNLKELTEFKEKLVKGIFEFLMNYKEIEQIFIFGSFLIKKIDYNDIDILILTNKNDSFEKMVYDDLINKFNLKFHLISFNGKKLKELLKICPLTRSMLYYYVSNKEFKIPKEININNEHIMFLLMMPEDLLKVNLHEGIEYYNALRKLCSIENFLIGKEIPPDKIDVYIEESIGKTKFGLLKRNDILDAGILKEVKSMVKDRLKEIYKEINRGKKERYQ